MRVYSLEEARNWFLTHRDQSVTCVDGQDESRCEAYPEAEFFYNAPIVGAHPDDRSSRDRSSDEQSSDDEDLAGDIVETVLLGEALGEALSDVLSDDENDDAFVDDAFEGGGSMSDHAGETGGGGSGGDF